MTDMDPDALPYGSAITQLCSTAWAPTGVHVCTEHTDIILQALLPSTRHDAGRVALGSSPGAIANLISILRDPLVFHEKPGLLTIRILRNICVRQPGNQSRAAEHAAHSVVLDAIQSALSASSGNQIETSRPSPLCTPFYGFAVEFLVNFVTGNGENARLVWGHAFPDILFALLRSDNHAAATASAALVHNCVVAAKDLLPKTFSLFPCEGGESSLLTALLDTVRHTDSENTESGDDIDRFLWVFGLVKRLVQAGFLQDMFGALGMSVDTSSKKPGFGLSAAQQTLLHVIEAGTGKSAEGADRLDDAFIVPTDTLAFLSTLFRSLRDKGDATDLRAVAAIIGSVIILSDDSPQLVEFSVACASLAIGVLQTVAERNAAGDNAAAAIAAVANGSSKSEVNCVAGKGGANVELLVNEVQGIKGTMVRLIAICCDGCRDAQDAVRKEGGIPFVLNALAYERDVTVNPFLREWAVLAVRNLTQNNEDNIREVNSFELLGVQHDKDLERAGLKIVKDENGKLRIRQSDKSM